MDALLALATRLTTAIADAVEPYITGANIAALVASWVLVEMGQKVLDRPRFAGVRERYADALYYGKHFGAVVWCSALVWIPGMQPELCHGPPAPGCQTVFERVALAIILGGILSVGHKGVIAWLRRRRQARAAP